MNNQHKYAQGFITSAMIGGVIVAVLFIYVLFLLITSSVRIDPDDTTTISVNNRIQPLGQLHLSDGIEPGSRTGEQVFQKTCIQCHAEDAQVANSPKITHSDQWAPRIAKGFDTLIENATNGFNAMPARGGNPDLTDEEIARAIAYMANQSGGNFEAPPVESEDNTETETSVE